MPLGWNPLNWFKGPSTSTFPLLEDDIVVFVVGPSGAGKSSFVKQVTKSDLIKIDSNLRPRTAKVQAIRCELTEVVKSVLVADPRSNRLKNIVFVDTPSFHTGLGGIDAEDEMHTWLRKSKSKSPLVGTIYMHRVETDPDIESMQKHLDAFASTFPQAFTPLPQRLHAVLSHEGGLSQDTIRDRRERFLSQLNSLAPKRRFSWQASLHPDLFSHEPEVAWAALKALFAPN